MGKFILGWCIIVNCIYNILDFFLQSSSFEVDEEGYRIRPPDSESILVLMTSIKYKG